MQQLRQTTIEVVQRMEVLQVAFSARHDFTAETDAIFDHLRHAASINYAQWQTLCRATHWQSDSFVL